MSAQQDKYPRLTETVSLINQVLYVESQEFEVGLCSNKMGESIGSLAILQFAFWWGLSVNNTLPLFCEAYDEVLNDPEGTCHPNIRALMKLCTFGEVYFTKAPQLQSELAVIDALWEIRDTLSPNNIADETNCIINSIISKLNNGSLRVAMKLGVEWFTIEQVKKAILLYFRINGNYVVKSNEAKFSQYSEDDFTKAGVSAVSNAVARFGSYIAPGVILMPSYVDIGARVESGTTVGTWASVGSCAQIGKNVHLSDGVGIGGLLESPQATPAIIEDNCWIGPGSMIGAGAIVAEGSVVGANCCIDIGATIVDFKTGIITRNGYIPPYSVVIAGTAPMRDSKHGLHEKCVIIKAQVRPEVRNKYTAEQLLIP